ncbi:virginiamycin B lyase family protein [Streptomyces boncukensis]|uniref:Virginiamycin B lyase n=1 Tax=Streptomyces boncukensis TaxID=2711219 RepID=A0A6G4WXQ3_9ACTN|nr:virginiamycin B lyase [Streptomyces boncukensis]NGO69231.1 virginiamycin B lyase [Streptomyces boncukensis]
MREFPVGGTAAGPYGVTTGPDGALWVTLVHSGEIARVVPPPPGAGAGDAPRVDVFPLDSRTCGPTVITPGPDGALWFTRFQDHRIGRITTRGTAESFPLPTPDSGPYGIAAGPDGALWCTGMNTDRIARITVEGEVTEFPLPMSGAYPSALAVGPDGALWCTLNQANALGRVSPAGEVTVHPLPTPGAAPVGLTCGTDGALWFAEIGAGAVGRLVPREGGQGAVTEFPLPDHAARPHAIVAAPGAGAGCWFTEWGGNRLGHISPEGGITEFPLPTPSSEPHGIAVGPDGAVWAALEAGALVRVPLP